MTTHRTVYTISHIDSSIQLKPVKTPHKTAYTELIREKANQENLSLAWLRRDKTSYKREAECMARWWPDWTACSFEPAVLTVSYNALPIVHPAVEYDLEVCEGRVRRVHYVHKLPMTPATMRPLVARVASLNRKRKISGVTAGSVVRKRFLNCNWNAMTEVQLRTNSVPCLSYLSAVSIRCMRNAMLSYLTWGDEEVPMKEYFRGAADEQRIICSYARVHGEIIDEAHLRTLRNARLVYRNGSASTAYETVHWMGPWFKPKENLDMDCPICLKPMSAPMVTVCGHACCNECMLKVTDKCPLCRQSPIPIAPWMKSVIWHDADVKDREHHVRDALAKRTIEWTTTVPDVSSGVVVAAHVDDIYDWECHYDHDDVCLVKNCPARKNIFVYQAHMLTLDDWELLLQRWSEDQPAIMHGRVDVRPPFRGSLFKSLSGLCEVSAVAPIGTVGAWGEREPVDQIFTASKRDAELVHTRLNEVKRVCLTSPRRVRTIASHIGRSVQFTRLDEHLMPAREMERRRADAMSIHRWPGGRVRRGAFVITAQTKGCVACALRTARAYCVEVCDVYTIDCVAPALTCRHDPCRTLWRTTLD